MIHSRRRSQPIAALLLLIAFTGLAACKGGDSADPNGSVTPPIGASTETPGTNNPPPTDAPQPGGEQAPTPPPTAPEPRVATLSWTAPTENTDGSALTDLAGFVILHGQSSTKLDQSVRIDNPSVSTYVLEDLPAGMHYFAVRAFTKSGAESEPSAMVSKQIG